MPRARLLVSSDQPNALLAVRALRRRARRLVDARHPRRSSTSRTARATRSHAPLVPGEPTPVTVALNAIAHAFPPGTGSGSRVSPTYWPWAWPSPVTAKVTLCARRQLARAAGASAARGRAGDPFRRTGLGAERRGRLPRRRLRAAARSSATSATGRLTITTDFSYFGAPDVPQRLRVQRGHARRGDRSCIGDPLSAEVRCERTIRMRQGEWSIRVEAWATMSSTHDAFIVTNGIDAYEGEARVTAQAMEPRRSRAISSENADRTRGGSMKTKNPNTVAAPLTARGPSRSRARLRDRLPDLRLRSAHAARAARRSRRRARATSRASTR